MRTYLATGAVILVIAVILSFFWKQRPAHSSILTQATSHAAPSRPPLPAPPPIATNGPPNGGKSPPPAAPIPVLGAAAADVDHEAEVQREKKVWGLLLLTPISFYGRVTDTEGQPVPDARVDVSFTDTVWDGHTKMEKRTDADGRFSAVGHGLGITVMVNKAGHYTTPQSSGTYDYAPSLGKTSTFSNPQAPAPFVLRKRGTGEPLISVDDRVDMTGDGTPTALCLYRQTTHGLATKDVVAQTWIKDQGIPVNFNQNYDWRLLVTVPGGGIQVRADGEFDFVAPVDGYQETDEIVMPADAKPWKDSVSRRYYVRLANGSYAHVDLAFSASKPYGVDITSYLNPQPGHRNLEYDPQQRIVEK